MLDWLNIIENFIAGALVVVIFTFILPFLIRRSASFRQLKESQGQIRALLEQIAHLQSKILEREEKKKEE